MANSYRQILRSSSIIGGASVINILLGLLRLKVVALVLGPAGVGLIGLFQNLIATSSAVSALGFGNVGTRQIAEAAGHGNVAGVAAARRALFWGTLILAVIGACVFWLLRGTMARYILGNIGYVRDVGWLALGVVLTVAAGSQTALLVGLRRISDVARVKVLSAVLSTVLGISALYFWGRATEGLLVFVLAAPFASFAMGYLYAARLPKVRAPSTPLPQLMGQWRMLVRLGTAFMAAGLAVTVGQLAVRTMVQRELGTTALGQFQAAWVISMTYVGFVLAAMSTDYYPRLTAAIRDDASANRMVNEQSEVALLLAGPVFLAMLGLAPWVIKLLYSNAFDNAVIVLRWQVVGDVLKIASWSLGFVILAAGDGRAFMLTESLAIAIFVGLVWLFLPLIGIQATGVAYLGMYALHLPIMYWLARRRTGFSWQRRVGLQLTILCGAAITVFLAALWSDWMGAVLGLGAAMALGLQSLVRLGHMADLGGPLGRVAGLSERMMMRLGVWRGY